jgi:hypothetical protein
MATRIITAISVCPGVNSPRGKIVRNVASILLRRVTHRLLRISGLMAREPAACLFLDRLNFDPENGSNTFLRNVPFTYGLHDAVSQNIAALIFGICSTYGITKSREHNVSNAR